jgi:putative hydrolase of the HAD superfamily
MIKAIFFDFYNTLVRFWPPLDQIQQAACRELGLNVTEDGINRGYSVADVYFNRENEVKPLALRSEDERLAFFARYEQIVLEHAEVPVTLHLAGQIWRLAMSVPKDFTPFDEVIESLARLQQQGYRLGVLSNLRRDMGQLCQRLGLAPYLDFCISSAEVGAEKPAPAIFKAALERAGVSAAEALHVGDQHRSDVLGARNAGLHAVLIDRGGWQTSVNDCVKVANLVELERVMAGAPASLSVKSTGVPDLQVGRQAAE